MGEQSEAEAFLAFCRRHFDACRRNTVTDAELLSMVEFHPALRRPESAPTGHQDVPNPVSRGEREGLRERAVYLVGNPSAWNQYDEGASEMIRQLLALLPTDPEPVNGELAAAAKVFADRAADMEALPDIGWIMLCYGRDEIATPTTVNSFRRLRTALSRAESLQGKGDDRSYRDNSDSDWCNWPSWVDAAQRRHP